jgi:hypothetical protein
MSVENVSYEMANGTFPSGSATPAAVVNVDDATYGKVMMFGYVTPASAVSTENTGSGYGVGCLLIDITNGSLYKNVGTTGTASFTEITS